MKANLKLLLALFLKARPILRRTLPKFNYPLMHEDLDYLIRDCQDLIASLDRGEDFPV